MRPDLILLDIMLPDSDGLDICKGIRRDPDLAAIPVIFLTARASETDRIVGLELGANDYVVKPFFVRELIARIKLQFRNQSAPAAHSGSRRPGSRSHQPPSAPPRRAAGADGHRIPSAGIPDAAPGVVFSREQLLNSVWGQDRAITDRAVDVYVLRLRQKVEIGPGRPVADSFGTRLRLHLRAAAGGGGVGAT